MERIEDIILRHSQRGMTKLRPYMDANYCRLAAEEIYSWKRECRKAGPPQEASPWRRSAPGSGGCAR